MIVAPNDDKLKGQLGNIGRGYHAFLKQCELHDAPLARMTYFWTVKKDYVENPVEDEEEQASIVRHLDQWMAETYERMVALMPPPPDSLILHVARAA